LVETSSPVFKDGNYNGLLLRCCLMLYRIFDIFNFAIQIP